MTGILCHSTTTQPAHAGQHRWYGAREEEQQEEDISC